MARTFVQPGRRLQFTPTLLHRAGHLAFYQGFYGVSQDDAVFTPSGGTVAARDHMLILDGVWDLPRNGFDASAWPMGRKVYANPTHSATTLLLYQNTASLGASSVAIGRIWATSAAGASLARVVLFGPENQGPA